MFSKEISGLTLTSDIASGLFQNIYGDNFSRDESFVATLRALLHSRVPQGESICLRLSRSNYNAGQLEGGSPRDCVRAFLRDSPLLRGEKGILYIHSFDGTDDSIKACMAKLKDGVPAAIDGYTLLNDVSAWIKTNGKFRARIYINAEMRNTVIFVGQLNLRRWHLLEALIPRYFPWYVEKAPFNGEEIALLKTLTQSCADEYEKRILEFTKKFDFRTEMIRSKLTGFETRCDQEKLQYVRRQIRDVSESIERLNRQFSKLYEQFDELNVRETGLTEKIRKGGGEENSELLDYFLLNKSLTLTEVTNSRIGFVVTTTMSNFDPDAADSMIRNKHGYFYHSYDTGDTFENQEMTEERIERLLREIFEKETLKLRLCAAYQLDFSSGDFCGIENYRFPVEIANEYTPNQHIQRYNCLGNNAMTIRESMMQRDYIGAIEACVASTKSVNVLEGATCGIMMDKIFSGSAGRIILMPDGSGKTPLEAMLWLEEQDAEKPETQEEKHE